ncbi:bone marrow proteoglycan [Nannospalax galili]|uniref:Proteoglycan 2, bone marrow n=1 Tax=Nannospalax galili TaxID=1026970 RepID=A0A8C6S069_NANGA|nr:bone marrow proteoglycan [Nannospalax galili]
MKLHLLLALLVGGASALHLRSETSDFESPMGDETLLQAGEILRQEAEECLSGKELMPPEEEEEEASGSEGAPEDEGAIHSVSALDVMDKDFQCPKEEDTVKLVGSPRFKINRFLLVRAAKKFGQAQFVCQRCYRGTLVSIHDFNLNSRIHNSVRGLNEGQIWIGGRVVGSGRNKCFRWVDGSSWNFAYWAAGQPQTRRGSCVTLCTQGGHWRLSVCNKRRPFICSY